MAPIGWERTCGRTVIIVNFALKGPLWQCAHCILYEQLRKTWIGVSCRATTTTGSFTGAKTLPPSQTKMCVKINKY
jgi:hypothetical protein